MPSSSTSARLAPLAPTPRSETPCEVGFATRLPDRRNRVKPGTWRSASSRVRAAVAARSSGPSTIVSAAVSLARIGVRVAVTVMRSKTDAGASTITSRPESAS